MSKIKLTEVKGRPMLNWVGKKTIDVIENYPAQLVETFNNDSNKVDIHYNKLIKDWSNLLFHGDNKEVLINLLQNGFREKIDLIYIDPPFDSKADYIRKVELRGKTNKEKLAGEGHNKLEQKQYFDIWKNDDYLQFMYERLILLKELLSDKGSIYLHCDWHKSHHLRCLLDEVFGEENFVNEIVWGYRIQGVGKTRWARKHDTIFFYAKSKNYIFNPFKETIIYEKPFIDTFKKKANIDGLNIKKIQDILSHIEQRKALPDKYKSDLFNVYYSEVYIRDVWDNDYTKPFISGSNEFLQYPTQKPEALLERIIKASSHEDSIVFDCFMGSGTTQAVAQKLGRKWIGADINKGAIQTTGKRLQKNIQQATTESSDLFTDKNYCNKFAHFKVNDYDLQILRTEAIELAEEKLGIEKLNDTFFNGKIGNDLVKFIEINRPLSLFDITDIQEELKKRNDEERNIQIVCLGQREDTKQTIDEWNKKSPVNKFEVIDLLDKEFMIRKPCEAEIELKDNVVTIKNFTSPTILQRLSNDKGVFKENIEDFKQMIDCVLIDNNYDGEVFNVVYSDVPEKKKELIVGNYKIEVKGQVAIKIIDMLGEEILVAPKITP